MPGLPSYFIYCVVLDFVKRKPEISAKICRETPFSCSSGVFLAYLSAFQKEYLICSVVLNASDESDTYCWLGSLLGKIEGTDPYIVA